MKDLFGNIDEEAMYQMALAVPLAEKIEKAISFIQSMQQLSLSLSDIGACVCFSGGKDSIVLAKLYEMSGVRHELHLSNTTIDPPELMLFVKKYYPHAIWHSVGVPLPLYMGLHPKGLPTRIGRWCCDIYKEQMGKGMMKAVGVRAAESSRRKGLWRTYLTDTRTRLPMLAPILYWTDADVWQFIKDNNMPYCSLYDEGYKRLGCIGCPLTSPEQQRKEFDRWPKHEALWKRGTKAHMERWKGIPTRQGKPRWIEQFNTWEEYWDWWTNGGYADTDNADCQMYLW